MGVEAIRKLEVKSKPWNFERLKKSRGESCISEKQFAFVVLIPFFAERAFSRVHVQKEINMHNLVMYFTHEVLTELLEVFITIYSAALGL